MLALEGMRKTTSGGYFLLHGTGAHQPVPSSEAHSLLHHARQADERALRAVVARHANLAESEGRARGSAGASGRRSDGVDKVQKTFATIWRQTPRATGGNGARSTFELGGRGGGARDRASGNSERRGDGASIEYRSNVDIRVGFGWVQTARGGAASPRPPRRFDVFALLAPSERGTEEETRYGSARGGGAPGCACAAGAVPHRRNRRHQPFPSIQTPSRSLTTPASAISEVAWRETEEESSSSRARQRNGRKRTCVNKASPRFYRAGRRLSGRLLSASNVDGSLVNNAGESHSATAPSLWGTAFKKSASSRTNNASNVRPRGDNAATTEICKSFFCFLARVPRIRPSHVWVFTQGSDDENPGKNNPRALE